MLTQYEVEDEDSQLQVGHEDTASLEGKKGAWHQADTEHRGARLASQKARRNGVIVCHNVACAQKLCVGGSSSDVLLTQHVNMLAKIEDGKKS